MSRYKVTADDNFHPGSEADRSEYGTFATAEAALDECRAIVDDSLLWEYRDGATAQELYERYADFGDSPLWWRLRVRRRSIFRSKPMPASVRRISPPPAEPARNCAKRWPNAKSAA